MVNASIKVGWTSPVVNTSRSFYIDRETRFPYIQQISHSETDAQVTESPAFSRSSVHSRTVSIGIPWAARTSRGAGSSRPMPLTGNRVIARSVI